MHLFGEVCTFLQKYVSNQGEIFPLKPASDFFPQLSKGKMDKSVNCLHISLQVSFVREAFR